MAQDSRNGSKGLCRVELNTLVRDYGEWQRGERESCGTISGGSSVGFQTRRNLHRNEKAAGKEIVKQDGASSECATQGSLPGRHRKTAGVQGHSLRSMNLA